MTCPPVDCVCWTKSGEWAFPEHLLGISGLRLEGGAMLWVTASAVGEAGTHAHAGGREAADVQDGVCLGAPGRD